MIELSENNQAMDNNGILTDAELSTEITTVVKQKKKKKSLQQKRKKKKKSISTSISRILQICRRVVSPIRELISSCSCEGLLCCVLEPKVVVPQSTYEAAAIEEAPSLPTTYKRYRPEIEYHNVIHADEPFPLAQVKEWMLVASAIDGRFGKNPPLPVRGQFVFEPPLGHIFPHAGENIIKVVFIPLDTNTYSSVDDVFITVTVDRGVPILEWKPPIMRLPFSDPLGPSILCCKSYAWRYSHSTTIAPQSQSLSNADGDDETKEERTENRFGDNAREMWIDVAENTHSEPFASNLSPFYLPSDIDINNSNRESQKLLISTMSRQIMKRKVHCFVLDELPGSLTYSPAEGTIFDRGFYPITVTFEPDDSLNYETNSATIEIQVIGIVPKLVWSLDILPAEFTYPQTISEENLKARVLDRSIQGHFTYDAIVGMELLANRTYTFTATFHPKDTYRYFEATVSRTVTIKKGVPVLSWKGSVTETYENSLLNDQVIKVSCTNRPPIKGTFTYSPPLGTLITFGYNTFTAVFHPDDKENYMDNVETSLTLWANRNRESLLYWRNLDPLVHPKPLTRAELCVEVRGCIFGNMTYDPPLGTVLPGGKHKLTAQFRSEVPGISDSSICNIIEILPGRPILTWSEPFPVLEGSRLDQSSLTCQCMNAEGTFEYIPREGTILQAGVILLRAKFIPKDPLNWTTQEMSQKLQVRQRVKRTVTITWETPQPIIYGTKLSELQLNAKIGGRYPGKLVYRPQEGSILPAGERELSVTFEPLNTEYFLSTTKTVTITVLHKRATITWKPKISTLSYGKPLTRKQLNAKADCEGAFIYTPPMGTKLLAGDQLLTAKFISRDRNVNPPEEDSKVWIRVKRCFPRLTWRLHGYFEPELIVKKQSSASEAEDKHLIKQEGEGEEGNMMEREGDEKERRRQDGRGDKKSRKFDGNGRVYRGGNDEDDDDDDEEDDEEEEEEDTEDYSDPARSELTTEPIEVEYPFVIDKRVHFTAKLLFPEGATGQLKYNLEHGFTLPVGETLFTCRFIPHDVENFYGAEVFLRIHCVKSKPTILWVHNNLKETITYGQSIKKYLQATCTHMNSGPESWHYTYPRNKILDVGVHTLEATFTPPSDNPDSVNYHSATITRTATVVQKKIFIQWSPKMDTDYELDLKELRWSHGLSADIIAVYTYGDRLGHNKDKLLPPLQDNLFNARLCPSKNESSIYQKLNEEAGGRIVYDPPLGSMLPAGYHNITAKYIPPEEHAKNNASSNSSFKICVLRTSPIVSFVHKNPSIQLGDVISLDLIRCKVTLPDLIPTHSVSPRLQAEKPTGVPETVEIVETEAVETVEAVEAVEADMSPIISQPIGESNEVSSDLHEENMSENNDESAPISEGQPTLEEEKEDNEPKAPELVPSSDLQDNVANNVKEESDNPQNMDMKDQEEANNDLIEKELQRRAQYHAELSEIAQMCGFSGNVEKFTFALITYNPPPNHVFSTPGRHRVTATITVIPHNNPDFINLKQPGLHILTFERRVAKNYNINNHVSTLMVDVAKGRPTVNFKMPPYFKVGHVIKESDFSGLTITYPQLSCLDMNDGTVSNKSTNQASGKPTGKSRCDHRNQMHHLVYYPPIGTTLHVEGNVIFTVDIQPQQKLGLLFQRTLAKTTVAVVQPTASSPINKTMKKIQGAFNALPISTTNNAMTTSDGALKQGKESHEAKTISGSEVVVDNNNQDEREI